MFELPAHGYLHAMHRLVLHSHLMQPRLRTPLERFLLFLLSQLLQRGRHLDLSSLSIRPDFPCRRLFLHLDLLPDWRRTRRWSVYGMRRGNLQQWRCWGDVPALPGWSDLHSLRGTHLHAGLLRPWVRTLG